jgi:hypothetical protein
MLHDLGKDETFKVTVFERFGWLCEEVVGLLHSEA